MQPNASLEKRLLANPTATEFAAMLSEHNAALSNFLDGTQDTPEAEERCSKAYDALWAARPNDPAVMAMQLRWLLREMDVGDYPDDRRVPEHVAEQLDAIAGVCLLSADAARQVRKALLHALDELEEIGPPRPRRHDRAFKRLRLSLKGRRRSVVASSITPRKAYLGFQL
jgi:hypothetical protein